MAPICRTQKHITVIRSMHINILCASLPIHVTRPFSCPTMFFLSLCRKHSLIYVLVICYHSCKHDNSLNCSCLAAALLGQILFDNLMCDTEYVFISMTYIVSDYDVQLLTSEMFSRIQYQYTAFCTKNIVLFGIHNRFVIVKIHIMTYLEKKKTRDNWS